MSNKINRIDKSLIGRAGDLTNATKMATITPKAFKTNLDKHFVSCARDKNLWEGFVEFKKSTEHNQALANSMANPETKKAINKVIYRSFSKIDSSSLHLKYQSAMSKLEKRYKNDLNLFYNSYINAEKDTFMDDIMQNIIAHDIFDMKKSDRAILKNLFSIYGSDKYKDKDAKYKALQDFSHEVLPDGENTAGKFSSPKVAKSFVRLNELCRQVLNYDTNMIASIGAHNTSLSFDKALEFFREDLNKSLVPVLEVANMYNVALDVKPLNISKFIYDQESRFVENIKLTQPNLEFSYNSPEILPDSLYEKPNIAPKNFIRDSTDKFVKKLGGIKELGEKSKVKTSKIITKYVVKNQERKFDRLKTPKPEIIKTRIME